MEDYGGALAAYSWQDLSPGLADKMAEMAEKLARLFTLSQISMNRYL